MSLFLAWTSCQTNSVVSGDMGCLDIHLTALYWNRRPAIIWQTLYQSSDTTSWWRLQMETFSAFRALCEEKPPVTDGFPSQRAVTRCFWWVFFICAWTNGFSKQSRRKWFEMPSSSLWCHFNVYASIGCEGSKASWSGICRCDTCRCLNPLIKGTARWIFKINSLR